MTVDDVFCAKQHLLKTGFWRVAEFDVEMMKMVFLPFAWQFGMSFIVFACACSTANSKPFSTWFYFNNFVDVTFVELVFVFCCM